MRIYCVFIDSSFTENEVTWKLALEVMMVFYATLLLVKEGLQMQEGGKDYFRRISNWIDLNGIVSVFITAILTAVYEGERDLDWIVDLIICFTLMVTCNLAVDVLKCFPMRNIETYFDMVFCVSRAYLRILAQFFPFLVAFSVAFRGI